jgi:hypothetical protein
LIEITLSNNGLIKEVKNKKEGTGMAVKQSLLIYNGRDTYSGLYIFNPKSEAKNI